MGGKRKILFLFLSILLVIPSFISAITIVKTPALIAQSQDIYKKMIVYIFEDSKSFYQLGMMEMDGRNKKILTGSGNNWSPAIASNGDKIVFYSDRSGSANLWTMDADGSHQVQITFDRSDINSIDLYNRGQIAWSKDSRLIYFLKNGDIWAIDLNGETPTVLTNCHDVTIFKLSPDREKIAFAREKTKRHNGIWVMLASGTDTKQLTDSNIINPSIDWADNSLIIYSTNLGISFIDYSGLSKKIFKETKTTANDLEWSKALPDKNSNYIAYIAGNNGVKNIFIARPDGSNEKQITKTGSFSPFWSTDGRALIYVESSNLYITDIEKSDKTRLTYDFSVYYPIAADIKMNPAAAK